MVIRLALAASFLNERPLLIVSRTSFLIGGTLIKFELIAISIIIFFVILYYFIIIIIIFYH
jgi:hypothetical protein